MSDVVGYRVAMPGAARGGAQGSRPAAPGAVRRHRARARQRLRGRRARVRAGARSSSSVVGVDLSADLVAAGNELAPPNCELIVGDATALAVRVRIVRHRRLHARSPSRPAPGARRLRARAGDAAGRPDPPRRPARLRRPGRLGRDRPLRAGARPVAHAAAARPGHPLPARRQRPRRADERDHAASSATSSATSTSSASKGDERRRVSGMAPGAVYEVEIGWYVARKRGGLARRVARHEGEASPRPLRSSAYSAPRAPAPSASGSDGLRDRAEPVREPRDDDLRLAALDRREHLLRDVAPGRPRTAGRAASRRSSDAGSPVSSRTRA